MQSQQGGDETAESGEDMLSSNTSGPKETPRRHVDALLDISEENSMKELESYEHHDPSEHAVRGWARVAPLSCLLTAQKNHRKPKHEVENHTPLCVDTVGPRAKSSASVKGQHGESRVGLSNCKKPVSANQQIDSSGPTKRPALNAMQEDMTRFLLKDKTEESLLKITPWRLCHLSSQYSVPEKPHTKPQQKHSHKPTNKALPGKSLAFSPPIQSPRTNPGSCHVCRGKKAPNGENPEQNFFMFKRKSAARRTGVDTFANPDLCMYSAAPTSGYHTSHHKPHLFSTLSLLKKNLMSPTSGTAHPTSYSVDKSISQAAVQTRLPPRCLS